MLDTITAFDASTNRWHGRFTKHCVSALEERNMRKVLARASVAIVAVARIALFGSAQATPLVADLRGGLDGSCNGSAFSSPTGQFSSSDVGKVLVVSGDANGTAPAGSGTVNNAPLFTTVVAVISGSTLTMANACASSMTGISTAQWHLGTDNTVALQECLNTGSCTVPAGRYLISGPATATPPQTTIPYDSRVYPPSESQLLCQSGAVFLFPHHDYYDNVNRSFLDLKGVQNVTISGCTISGTNLHNVFTLGAQGNYAIVIHGSDPTGRPAMNNSILDNTIENGWSDGDITMNNYFNGDAVAVPSNNLVARNTISGCGLNGIAIVSGTGNIIRDNNLTDCNIDIEPNDAGNGPVFGNLIKGNTLTKLHRPGVEAARDGYIDDPTLGRHYVFSFSSCATAACNDTGGDTIAVVDNTFFGNIQLLPYCRNGRVNQVWTNNVTKLVGGQPCTLNASGCGYAPAYLCIPPAGSNVDHDAIDLVNSVLLGD